MQIQPNLTLKSLQYIGYTQLLTRKKLDQLLDQKKLLEVQKENADLAALATRELLETSLKKNKETFKAAKV